MSITKVDLVKYIIARVERSNGPLSKLGKEFHSFLTVALTLSSTLSMIFLICIFYSSTAYDIVTLLSSKGCK